MDEYLIGSGAVLTAGSEATIARATLHAQTPPHVAAGVKAAVIDFESVNPSELSRIVVVLTGCRRSEFRDTVETPLLARGECGLADVIAILARAANTPEVHVFARWAPDAELSAATGARGVRLVIHPLESIEQAALVSGQRFSRWPTPVRAA